MSFDWIEFLNLARELQGGQSSPPCIPEARHRTIASRAYYSIRSLAMDYAVAHGAKENFSEYNHGQLWTWYMQQPDRNLQTVGQELQTLYSLRRKADYVPSVPRAADSAYTAILLAESIQSALA